MRRNLLYYFKLGVAHGQENSTIDLREIQTMLNNQTHDLGVIKNITSAQNKVLEKVTTTLSKSATQGAYTALSVFFLGISLVVLGLKMSFKGLQNFGRYFNLMVWASRYPRTCANSYLPNWNRKQQPNHVICIW